MSSDRHRGYLDEIVAETAFAISIVDGLGVEAFAQDGLRRRAAERSIEIVCEAAIRIGPDDWERLVAGIPHHVLRGLGNRMRHEYDRLDIEVLFQTIVEDLPLLHTEAKAAIGKLGT